MSGSRRVHPSEGLEVLLSLAAADPVFRARLLEDRAGAASLAGVQLAPTERVILDGVPAEQLAQMIRALRPRPRATRLGQLASVLIAALAAPTAGCRENQASTGAPASDAGSTTDGSAQDAAHDADGEAGAEFRIGSDGGFGTGTGRLGGIRPDLPDGMLASVSVSLKGADGMPDMDRRRRLLAGRFRQCYYGITRNEPGLSGVVNLRLSIDDGGHVSEAKILSRRDLSDKMAECVRSHADEVVFPGLAAGTSTLEIEVKLKLEKID